MKNLANIWGKEVEELREYHLSKAEEKRQLKKMRDSKPIISNKRKSSKD